MDTPDPIAPIGLDRELASLSKATQGLLLNAALVSRFRPERLSALDGATLEPIEPSEAERQAALAYVIENSTAVGFGDPERFGWTLNEDLRARVLGTLGTIERVRAAIARAAPGVASIEPLQRFFGPPTSDTGGATGEMDAISARRQALVWLQPLLENDGDLQELDREVRREALLAPLHALAGRNFVGRGTELEFLRRFVGVLPPAPAKERSTLQSLGNAIRRFGADIVDWASTVLQDDDVVLVTAPGGMGKSSLLARFVLDHYEAGPQLRTPFAFLDFDRPSLLSRSAAVPLEEIARQLSIQLDAQIDVPWRDEEAADAPTVGTRSGAQVEQVTIEASAADRAYLRQRDLRALAMRIAAALVESPFTGKPIVIVIDTLERVFRRGRHWIAAIDETIGVLRAAGLDVRVVAGGRAFLSELRDAQTLGTRAIRWQERKLRELDADAASELLVKLGVPSQISRQIADQVGGVPLTLHLAADYVKRHAKGIGGLAEATRSWLFKRRLDDQIVQGNLYQRILSHIEHPDVARLACPGLVLREVTPALIQHVLAEPCGLRRIDETKARELFDKLAEEFTLVEATGADRLRHRSDVRQLMLKQMFAEHPERSRRISEAAVAYFSQQADLRSRAEEIYHRLLLGDDRQSIDARWIEGVGDFLGEEIIDDIPSIALRVYAASRLNLTVRDEQWLQEADQQTWERKVAQDFEGRLRLGQVREALQLVSGRTEFTPGSRLYPLVAQAYADLHEYAQAASWVQIGLASLDRVTDPERYRTALEIFLVRARIFEHVAHADAPSRERVAQEIAQLDMLWREYDGDPRVILLALLEREALSALGDPAGADIDPWLLGRMRETQDRGGTIDPSIAMRMLAIVGVDSARLDESRWLIDLPGVCELLLPVYSRALRTQPSSDPRAIGLIDKLRRAADPEALRPTFRSGSANFRHGSAKGAALDADEVAWLAAAVSRATDETRQELRGVTR